MREGKDPAFGKGSKAYNRYQGDALHAPNSTRKPLETDRSTRSRWSSVTLGTYAGLTTDEHSRVLGGDRQPIAGLYAVGNDIASIMGGNYPGAGITLSRFTFGHIAGRHLADVPTGLSADDLTDPETRGAQRTFGRGRRHRGHGRSGVGGQHG